MKKILLIVLVLQSSYAHSDYWTSLNKMESEAIHLAILHQNNYIVFYCPTCGDNGMFEYYHLENTVTVPSDWDKGKLEIKTKGTIIFKAVPVINNRLMSFKNMRCFDDKTFKNSSLATISISLNYHFLLENNHNTWLSFAKVLDHKELPKTPEFMINNPGKKILGTCISNWQHHNRK